MPSQPTYVASVSILDEKIGVVRVEVKMHHDPSIGLSSAGISILVEVILSLFCLRWSDSISASNPVRKLQEGLVVHPLPTDVI